MTLCIKAQKILLMNISLNLDKDLLDQALEMYPDKTKKEIVEIGLQELIRVSKRKELGQLFGSQKNLNLPRRAHRKNYHET